MRKQISLPATLILLALLSWARPALAAPAEVVDEAGFFSPETVARANQDLGWRNRPSDVHSANLISTTSFGETQCAGSLVRGATAKGEVRRSSLSRRARIARRPSRSKPPPMWPT